MTDEYPLINVEKAKEDAYHMGYDRFEGSDTVESPELEYVHDTAYYANHVLPALRAMAGYDDSMGGTYTYDRDVAITDYENESVEIIHSNYIYDELVDAWNAGAYDALSGEQRDAERAF